jgi:hypothetical protein
MLPARKQLDIDARWLYWRLFLLFFVVFELIVWQRLQRMPMRPAGHRVLVFLFAGRATPRSLELAIIAGGVLTLLAMLIVRLIVRPLLSYWLHPTTDLSGGLFHLTASETIIASVPARRSMGWMWKPGSLTLTTHRLWFFPAEYSDEPWYLPLDDVAEIVPERPSFAELAPVRNWPEHLRVSGRSGPDAVFALAEPNVVLAWPKLRARRDRVALLATGAGQSAGVFDE